MTPETQQILWNLYLIRAGMLAAWLVASASCFASIGVLFTAFETADLKRVAKLTAVAVLFALLSSVAWPAASSLYEAQSLELAALERARKTKP